jgi:hypothetical protein
VRDRQVEERQKGRVEQVDVAEFRIYRSQTQLEYSIDDELGGSLEALEKALEDNWKLSNLIIIKIIEI